MLTGAISHNGTARTVGEVGGSNSGRTVQWYERSVHELVLFAHHHILWRIGSTVGSRFVEPAVYLLRLKSTVHLPFAHVFLEKLKIFIHSYFLFLGYCIEYLLIDLILLKQYLYMDQC